MAKLISRSSMPRTQSLGLSINYPALDSSVPTPVPSYRKSKSTSWSQLIIETEIRRRQDIESFLSRFMFDVAAFLPRKTKISKRKKKKLSFVQGNRFMGCCSFYLVIV
ncbi:hypothetical protein CDAR_241561 [Caerostris darwini]|uniref:Uncharacterized protein n=1 Tax=Caerostris darwini TaxID=1538125 RepID=A0AAV4QG13_9ARAC|nr:hypothetical protein CDAR_241561 [Caerostris darwini]